MIKTEKFDSLDKALSFIESIIPPTDIVVFRGQNKDYHIGDEDGLKTPFRRLIKSPLEPWMAGYPVDQIILKFSDGLAKVNEPSIKHDQGRSLMEYARHFGAPVPCLDFSYSPYVALFFAFIDFKRTPLDDEEAIIYVLNVTSLAITWIEFTHKLTMYSNRPLFLEKFKAFIRGSDFKKGYPANTLQFFHAPSKWNQRMQHQQGAFLYDTLVYERFQKRGLEHLILDLEESMGATKPILYKIHINVKKCIRKVFEKLELMNIKGVTLFSDPSGVVMDIYNEYHYNPRNPLSHDIILSKPEKKVEKHGDDGKI